MVNKIHNFFSKKQTWSRISNLSANNLSFWCAPVGMTHPTPFSFITDLNVTLITTRSSNNTYITLSTLGCWKQYKIKENNYNAVPCMQFKIKHLPAIYITAKRITRGHTALAIFKSIFSVCMSKPKLHNL